MLELKKQKTTERFGEKISQERSDLHFRYKKKDYLSVTEIVLFGIFELRHHHP